MTTETAATTSGVGCLGLGCVGMLVAVFGGAALLALLVKFVLWIVG